jgi:hypothetical protein
MKFVFALICIVLVSGCYKSQPDPNSPFSRPPVDPNKPTFPVGFTAHAWCYNYNDGHQDVEDRFMFVDGGSLNYERSAWVGQRGPLLGQASGTWTLNGTVLQMLLNSQRFVYQVQYNVQDQQTGRERLHLFMNGTDVKYDPCN